MTTRLIGDSTPAKTDARRQCSSEKMSIKLEFCNLPNHLFKNKEEKTYFKQMKVKSILTERSWFKEKVKVYT